MTPELIVADDVAAKGAQLFLEIAPRTVALAGGTTPRSIYERLAESGYDWGRLDVFFGDERCVPPDHHASNYAMAYRALLSKVTARVHRMRGESCDADGYEQELRSFFGEGPPRFDLALLGLGEDGHTASLFPGDAALEIRDRWVAHVQRADFDRLTLTMPVLSAAAVALFLVTGQEKRWALRELLRGGDIPASRVEAKRVMVIADKTALPLGYRPSA